MDDSEAVERLGPVFLDSYFVVNRDRKLTSFNSGFLQLIEAKPSDRKRLLHTNCYDALRLEICRDNCIALECLKKNAPVRMQEIHGKSGSGRDLVLELSATPLRDENGEITGVFVTHRDVTDEKRLKERYMEEQVEHKKERNRLLKVIDDRDVELERVRTRAQEASERRT